MKKEFDRRRAYMYDRVKAMPYVDVSKPQGAFYVFIDMSKAVELSYKGEKLGSASKLAQCLLNDYAVAVIPCADFGFPNHIRLSYAISIGQIEKGLGRIEEFLKELQ
jgi:aspartate aminotransferase